LQFLTVFSKETHMPDAQGHFSIDEVQAQETILENLQVKAFSDAGAYITALKAQVAAGSPVTPAQLDVLFNHLKATSDATVAFDTANSAPPAVIPPLPPPPPPPPLGPRHG
jgi:hypothetical protein